jgi:hypothetical protein
MPSGFSLVSEVRIISAAEPEMPTSEPKPQIALVIGQTVLTIGVGREILDKQIAAGSR